MKLTIGPVLERSMKLANCLPFSTIRRKLSGLPHPSDWFTPDQPKAIDTELYYFTAKKWHPWEESKERINTRIYNILSRYEYSKSEDI